MMETTRAHGRIAPHVPSTRRVMLEGILSRPVELHLPPGAPTSGSFDLLIHFLGPAFLAVDAARAVDSSMVVAVVNLAPGSSAYQRPFDAGAWRALIDRVTAEVAPAGGGRATLGGVYLSAFSAGNGAVRAILADRAALPLIRGVVILDGIHTGYLPDRRVLADSGQLDPANLQSLHRFAQRAVRGEVRMLVTHSEVFPGTFASTTETADWLLHELALSREAVLARGPNGMQQTSMIRAGGFTLMGFAGNSAPTTSTTCTPCRRGWDGSSPPPARRAPGTLGRSALHSRFEPGSAELRTARPPPASVPPGTACHPSVPSRTRAPRVPTKTAMIPGASASPMHRSVVRRPSTSGHSDVRAHPRACGR
jgi:hypothetical protein